jgi:hypothetical protein
MSAVWEVDLPAGEKLVLLALADCANDEGRCWPGVASLCRKTGKAERSLQGALKALESGGHITRDQIPGKGCRYMIHPTLSLFTPAKSAPRNKCAPQDNADTPAKSAGTPAKSAGKPSKKHQEPSIPKKRAMPLPSDWKPEGFGTKTKCAQIIAGWTEDRLESEIEAFMAHHQTRANCFPDWQAGWKTWVLNSARFDRSRNNGNGTSGIGKSAAAFAMLDASDERPF